MAIAIELLDRVFRVWGIGNLRCDYDRPPPALNTCDLLYLSGWRSLRCYTSLAIFAILEKNPTLAGVGG